MISWWHIKQSDEWLSLPLLLPFVVTVRSEALVAIYGSVTSITVALMVNSMVQCNMILAAILKNGKTYVSEAEEEEFMFRCRVYAFYYMPGSRPPYPRRTFQRMWERRFEANWRIAFRMFSIGVPFFLIMLGVVAWVKFNSEITAILISSVRAIRPFIHAGRHRPRFATDTSATLVSCACSGLLYAHHHILTASIYGMLCFGLFSPASLLNECVCIH